MGETRVVSNSELLGIILSGDVLFEDFMKYLNAVNRAGVEGYSPEEAIKSVSEHWDYPTEARAEFLTGLRQLQ